MAWEIRPYHPSFKPQILDLSLRAWAPVFAGLRPAVPGYVYDAFYPDGWEVRQRLDVAAILDATGNQIFVAMEGSLVRGWVGIRIHAEDSMGEIHILAVDPAHQQRGIGGALTNFACERLRKAGMRIVMVETGDDPGHAPARRLYEGGGFERWPVARYFRKL